MVSHGSAAPELLQRVRLQRFAELEALHQMAPVGTEELTLRIAFNAFSDNVHAQTSRQVNDGAGEACAARLGGGSR